MQLVSYNSVLVTKQKYRMHLMEKKTCDQHNECESV